MNRMNLLWLRQSVLLFAGALMVTGASAQSGLSLSESGSAAALLVADESFNGGSAAAGQNYGHTSTATHKFFTPDRIAFEAGGGFNAPAPESSDYITWGGNFNLGAGLYLTNHLSALVEYQFLNDKLPKAIIGEAGAQAGHAHIWGFTVNPVYDFFPKKRNSFYVTGGGGFYRKVTSFTDPVLTEYCDYYYCDAYVDNAVVGHFSSNQAGWNAGAGYSWKIGAPETGRMKLFVEARYLFVDTPAVTTEPNGLGTTTVAAGTKLIPVTIGLRW